MSDAVYGEQHDDADDDAKHDANEHCHNDTYQHGGHCIQHSPPLMKSVTDDNAAIKIHA